MNHTINKEAVLSFAAGILQGCQEVSGMREKSTSPCDGEVSIALKHSRRLVLCLPFLPLSLFVQVTWNPSRVLINSLLWCLRAIAHPALFSSWP